MVDLKEAAEQIISAVENLDEVAVLKFANEALDAGLNPPQLVEWIAEGMVKVGQRYEVKEYFIADLIMAGTIFKSILQLDRMQAHFKTISANTLGIVLLGTVKGDIHDIGKDILKGMLEANNFKVIDLGVDVPSEIFVAKFEEFQPDIIGLSGVLSSTIEPMKDTVNAFVDSGNREKVKIILGGSHLTAEACHYIGADNFANDVSLGVRICKEWMLSKKRKGVSSDE